MQNSKKFKFPYDTRTSDQVNSEYKDVVRKFSNSNVTPVNGKVMKWKNLQPYRVMKFGFALIAVNYYVGPYEIEC